MFFRTLRRARSRAGITCAIGLLATATTTGAQAQSFFSTVVVDPSVGVDRGSAGQIQKLDERTTFLTFDTYGAFDIGRSIASIGFVLPGAMHAGDQLDIVGVVAGPASNGSLELLAGGIGYRFALARQTTGYVRADYGDITLGTAANLALGGRGERASLAFGIRRVRQLQNKAKLTFNLELGARQVRGEILGTTIIDEDLRYARASLLYEKGIPFFFQQRFAVSATKGFDAFGASPSTNPLASSPGATSEFLRASFSAEASLPLSKSIVTNLGVIGQWSDDSLPTSQRCGYGTNAYMRGFDQSFVNGDQCLGGRVEIAYNVTLPDPKASKLSFTQAYFGVDAGWVQDNANAVLPKISDEWSSGSIGVRTIQGNFIGEVSATRIFDEPAGIVAQSRNRLWLRAAIKF